ncbi:MAG: methyltransferase domain-containing protein [Anaerolineae bacterium]|jgi:SAM-dependent methyltransferase|nr:methyltransferase domain-containing protein [Anaerolineae bacterium]MDH7473260.1 methyltransferase domain-containing protein [Anaerolineae bacterium]
MDAQDKAIILGHPSYVWRYGQERRLNLINRYAPLAGKRILDAGCGLGMYVRAFHRFSDQVYGVDIDAEKVEEAGRELSTVLVASAEALPFPDGFFDVVLSHEVLEHVEDDRQGMKEACRVLRPGGRLVVFVPNRLWLFETHGIYWRGEYRFGNFPLVNWLPDRWRNKLAPHVRAYTWRSLRALFSDLPLRAIHHSTIYPGFDNVAARHPALAKLVRIIAYAGERLPVLSACGLSHILVLEKT